MVSYRKIMKIYLITKRYIGYFSYFCKVEIAKQQASFSTETLHILNTNYGFITADCCAR